MQQLPVAVDAAAQSIADSVRAERHRRRKTQDQAAREIGITQDAYARRESGKVSFSAAELLVIAEAFGMDVAEFYPARQAALRADLA